MPITRNDAFLGMAHAVRQNTLKGRASRPQFIDWDREIGKSQRNSGIEGKKNKDTDTLREKESNVE